MLKMASESFIHALLLFLGLYLKFSRWVPLTLQIGAAHFRSVTEIAPPQLFLYVNRGPIRYDFRGGAKYRKIPKISPSKYKPPKPVTRKTLR